MKTEIRASLGRIFSGWKRRVLLVIAVVGLIALLAHSIVSPIVEANTVRVLLLDGVIMSGQYSGVDPQSVGRLLSKSRNAGAVVLRVNSNGGSVVACQEVLDTILRFKNESGVPVVVSIGDAALSGGYYIALGADEVIANEGSLIGSIGVISQFVYIDGLLGKLGVEVEVVKSGEYKDIGSRTLTAEEREIIQRISDDVHRQFMGVVAVHRGLSIENVELIATGEIFSGGQALELGLVDDLGTLNYSVGRAAELAGLSSFRTDVQSVSASTSLFGLVQRAIGVDLSPGLRVDWQR